MLALLSAQAAAAAAAVGSTVVVEEADSLAGVEEAAGVGVVTRSCKARPQRRSWCATPNNPASHPPVPPLASAQTGLDSDVGGGLTREAPLPSTSPHDHMIWRVDLVDSHGRRPCLQTAHLSIWY